MYMKKITYLILVLIVVSCNFFKEKSEYSFTYEFENENQITQREIIETINILEKRLNKFGTDHKIEKQKGKRLRVKIKAFNLDSTRLNSIIVNQGKLEFWELFKGEDFNDFLIDVNRFFTEGNVSDSIDVQPLFDKIASASYQGSPVLFLSKTEDTSVVSKMLNHKEVRFLIPSEYSNIKFLWGTVDENGHHPLYAAKSNRNNKPPLTGESVTEAIQNYDAIGKPTVSITMNNDGALTWERLTGNAFHNSTCIAVTLNDLVYTAPGVTVGAIKGGRSEVSGDFTLRQAQDLAIILSSQGDIPKLKLVNK